METTPAVSFKSTSWRWTGINAGQTSPKVSSAKTYTTIHAFFIRFVFAGGNSFEGLPALSGFSPA